MARVVAVCGMPGSSKGEFAAILSEAGVPIVSMGDMIRAEVAQRGLDEAPHVFGEVAAELRAEFGEDVLAVRLCDHVDALLSNHSMVLIEGLRGTAEEDAVFSARWGRHTERLPSKLPKHCGSSAFSAEAVLKTATGRPLRPATSASAVGDLRTS